MFTEKDLHYFNELDISVEKVNEQLLNFQKGFPYIQLIKPALVGDGLFNYDHKIDSFISTYEEFKESKKVVKFIPASGAATRMFKDLYTFMELYEGNKEGYNEFMRSSGLNVVTNVILNIEKFAFCNDLNDNLKRRGLDLHELIHKMNLEEVFHSILGENGLNYGELPKALLKFHQYRNHARTALEEHLVEGAEYANCDGKVNVHFTVSHNHVQLINQKLTEVLKQYEQKYSVKINVELSQQKKNTDIIAVDLNNKPFRDTDGNILLRPGGHGALIENLNEIDSDIIFIKNIDNVVPDYLRTDTIKYKKLIAGILIHYQKRIFDYLKDLGGETDSDQLKEIESFLTTRMSIIIPKNIDNRREWMRNKLNRPIRVCGMVKNQGEPGGGPFWTMNDDGSISLQIVESSQIDKNIESQKHILMNSTHFNPVDLVCGVKNYRGEKFNLLDFVDTNTGFISKKSKDGKELKAQELPGLWNGAMADWNTIFVEVPLITFNPVKTINDFLREEHQPKH